MKKFLAALTAAIMVALPANAQQTLPSQWSHEFKARARFQKQTVFVMGAGGQLCNARGAVYNLTATASSSTSATVARTLVLPANSLVTTGNKLRVRVFGRCAANGNTKVVNFVFGSTTVVLLNAASNAKDLYADIEICRTGANAQQITVAGYANGALLDNLSTTSAQAETATITLGVSVPATTGAADFVLTGLTIIGESG